MKTKVEIRNTYFKVPFGGPLLMSGLPLPDPKDGPFKFIGCDFHPGLSKVLPEQYADSEFVDCEMP